MSEMHSIFGQALPSTVRPRHQQTTACDQSDSIGLADERKILEVATLECERQSMIADFQDEQHLRDERETQQTDLSATQKVFQTYELAEMIFSYLSLEDLNSVQKTSKFSKDVILSSKTIGEKFRFPTSEMIDFRLPHDRGYLRCSRIRLPAQPILDVMEIYYEYLSSADYQLQSDGTGCLPRTIITGTEQAPSEDISLWRRCHWDLSDQIRSADELQLVAEGATKFYWTRRDLPNGLEVWTAIRCAVRDGGRSGAGFQGLAEG